MLQFLIILQFCLSEFHFVFPRFSYSGSALLEMQFFALGPPPVAGGREFGTFEKDV